ncbi:ATP-dependent Clp protease proteolytic subunit [Skermanella sp. TT6]|uniref:ATP-dependent Clp protease proteolytic subunit n=1 Tax=Skermanella cutis TaxID=2775420 RepID=A0ABX7B439_9PROT|nr:ATP-dependent Clp protease proteolytic subunit [Skermanella sp. TT6]QQP87271.1 ATP-dependent Clp protease proteolytic subunit [Skermanella sp. TT6]
MIANLGGWGVMMRAAVVLAAAAGIALSDHLADAVGDVTDAAVGARHTDLFVSGGLTHRAGREIVAFIEAHRGEPVRLVLDSPGGYAGAADRVREAVREHGAVGTVVAGYTQCASACTAIFAAGRSRAAGENARFVFHAPRLAIGPVSMPDPFGGDPARYAVPEDPGGRIGAALQAFLERGDAMDDGEAGASALDLARIVPGWITELLPSDAAI